MQLPTVGRVVHYMSHGTPPREDGSQAYPPECRAAVITEVGEYPPDVPEEARGNVAVPVGLAVLNPTGYFFNRGVRQSEVGREGGTWHWPERTLAGVTAPEGFHAHSGWYFTRCPDGAVSISHPGSVDPQEVVFDPDTWASAVASVSAGGETGDRFRAARQFHDDTTAGGA